MHCHPWCGWPLESLLACKNCESTLKAVHLPGKTQGGAASGGATFGAAGGGSDGRGPRRRAGRPRERRTIKAAWGPLAGSEGSRKPEWVEPNSMGDPKVFETERPAHFGRGPLWDGPIA